MVQVNDKNANWFVGIPISGDGWFEEVIEQLPENLRVFNSKDLHITVAFLGKLQIEEDKVNRKVGNIKLVLEEMKTERKSFRLGGVLFLPSKKRFSAVCLSIEQGSTELSELILQYEPILKKCSGLKEMGMWEKRKPLPHVTIARPLKKLQWNDRRNIVENCSGIKIPFCDVLVNKVALYTWADNRKMMQFKIICEAFL